MKDILTIEAVTKKYRKKLALIDVNIEITNGMFGLIGHNGAGKTSLMRIVSTLIKPTEGTVKLNGIDLHKNIKFAKENIGYLPQDFEFYPHLNARESLNYIAKLNGYKKQERHVLVEELLKKVNLSHFSDTRVGEYSGGMRRRLGIAAALVKNPMVIIVDEPTAGLDPEERVRFRTLLTELSEEKIVILSTHIVEDISASCQKIALLDQGELKFLGRPSEWLKQVEGKVYETHVSSKNALIELKSQCNIVSIVQSVDGTRVRYISESPLIQTDKRVEANLEDCYLYHRQEKVN